jgi:site-specific DNA recombinase
MAQQAVVAGYFRVSQARDDMHAPELYIGEIERYCSYRGLELVKIFSDIDYSAFRGAKARPALEELKARRAEFDAVIVPKLSRFGRSVKDLVRLFELFDRDGIALTFLDMNIDTSTSQGRLLRHILAAFAEYESDVKSDYSRANLRMIASEGRPHGPRAPYGYIVVGKRRDKTYVIDKERAPLVREIFKRYVAGYSLARLARELNARGVKGTHGGVWSRARLKVMLRTPAYEGLCRYKDETFKANWPPLISRALFERAERLRLERRKIYGCSSGQDSHLLSGLLVCGVCRANLTYHTTHDRLVYECRASEDRGRHCLGGQISASIAEHLVTGGRTELLALVNAGPLARPADELEVQWSLASLATRRALLGEVIDSVELTARPAGNRHGRGRRPGRRLLIHWREAWGRTAFGYAGATSLVSRLEPHIARELSR